MAFQILETDDEELLVIVDGTGEPVLEIRFTGVFASVPEHVREQAASGALVKVLDGLNIPLAAIG